jgi:hypothetical protein
MRKKTTAKKKGKMVRIKRQMSQWTFDIPGVFTHAKDAVGYRLYGGKDASVPLGGVAAPTPEPDTLDREIARAYDANKRTKAQQRLVAAHTRGYQLGYKRAEQRFTDDLNATNHTCCRGHAQGNGDVLYLYWYRALDDRLIPVMCPVPATDATTLRVHRLPPGTRITFEVAS